MGSLKNKLFILFVIFMVIGAIYGLIFPEDDEKKSKKNYSNSNTSTTQSQSSTNSNIGDSDKYSKCYAQMTKLHKKTGMHDSNRSGSIEAKETICGAYSRGELSDYPK